jgi:hypothetical protein
MVFAAKLGMPRGVVSARRAELFPTTSERRVDFFSRLMLIGCRVRLMKWCGVMVTNQKAGAAMKV